MSLGDMIPLTAFFFFFANFMVNLQNSCNTRIFLYVLSVSCAISFIPCSDPTGGGFFDKSIVYGRKERCRRGKEIKVL